MKSEWRMNNRIDFIDVRRWVVRCGGKRHGYIKKAMKNRPENFRAK